MSRKGWERKLVEGSALCKHKIVSKQENEPVIYSKINVQPILRPHFPESVER